MILGITLTLMSSVYLNADPETRQRVYHTKWMVGLELEKARRIFNNISTEGEQKEAVATFSYLIETLQTKENENRREGFGISADMYRGLRIECQKTQHILMGFQVRQAGKNK